MALKFVRTESVSLEDVERLRLDEEDLQRFAEHAQEIERLYKGKYVAIVNKQLYAGESFEEAETLARNACPERDPLVEQIPLKSRLWVL